MVAPKRESLSKSAGGARDVYGLARWRIYPVFFLFFSKRSYFHYLKFTKLLLFLDNARRISTHLTVFLALLFHVLLVRCSTSARYFSWILGVSGCVWHVWKTTSSCLSTRIPPGLFSREGHGTDAVLSSLAIVET